MNLSDLLGWISRNGIAAFLIGCFLITLAGIASNFFIRLARSITGHYPPASPSSSTESDSEGDEDDDGA